MLKISSSVSPTEINTGQQRSSGIGRWSTTYIPHISPNPSNTCCPQTSIPSQHERRGAGPGGIETLSSYLAEPWILQPTRTTVKRFNILQVKSQSFLSIFNPHLKKNNETNKKINMKSKGVFTPGKFTSSLAFGPNTMLIFLFVWCSLLSHSHFCKWTRNCKQNHTCAKVIHSLDRNSQAGKIWSAKTG